MKSHVMVAGLCLASARVADCDMIWGSATAAYQVEGYRFADGRQPSVWDAFDTVNKSWNNVIHATKPNGATNVFEGENADKACEDYKRYPESIDLVKELGFGAVRLSISWSRVMHYSHTQDGDLRWERNEAGIEHYRKVLRGYKEKGIQTGVTIYHWDTPLAIEEFAAKKPCGSTWVCVDLIPGLFAEYANLLFTEYGRLTDWWITLNEPLTIVQNGHVMGAHAPGRCSDRKACYAGDASTEPYKVAKSMILSHARAFRLWEKHGRPGKGCGITLNADWRIPLTDSKADREAAQRSLEWQAAVFADPIHLGRWPASMVERAGDRLPAWTEDELKLVKGAHDGNFFMNHYTTNYAWAAENQGCGWSCDAEAATSGYHKTTGKPVGTPSSNGWLFNYGPGLAELVNWYNDRYPGLGYLVTENGWGNATSTMENEMGKDDLERCNFYRDYIGNLSAKAASNNLNVKAYFAWSLMDNYEWSDGFSVRFGLTYVDYDTGKRTPKMSARWFQKYVTPLKKLPTDGQPLPACHMSLLEADELMV